MPISASSIIYAAVGFFLAVITVPIAMAQIIGTSVTSWNAAVVTIFQVLVPVLAMVGIVMYFVTTGVGKAS
jgi:hypothetical protein